MSSVALIGGIGLLVAGSMLAVARAVTFLDAVYAGTRHSLTRDESMSVWHGAIRAHLPGVLLGSAIALLGAVVLGWFTR